MAKTEKYVHHTGYDHLTADPAAALDHMEVAAEAGVTTMLWGSPGIGKTSICKQLGKRLKLPTTVFNPSQIDMIDIKFPYLEKREGEQVSRFALSDIIPRERCLVVVDEINTALPATQPMWFSLTLERRIGTHILPEGSVVVCTGNREFDRSAAQPMALAQKDRMCHINVRPSGNAFHDWGLHNGIREEILAFVKTFEDALESANPDDPCGGCTPRSLEQLSRLLDSAEKRFGKGKLDPRFENVLIKGTIGEGEGCRFEGFLDIFRNQISFEDLLDNPEKYKLPDKSDIKYSIAIGLAQRAKESNMKAVCTYLQRMEPTYSVVAMKDIVTRSPTLRKNAHFIKMAKSNTDLVLDRISK